MYIYVRVCEVCHAGNICIYTYTYMFIYTYVYVCTHTYIKSISIILYIKIPIYIHYISVYRKNLKCLLNVVPIKKKKKKDSPRKRCV